MRAGPRPRYQLPASRSIAALPFSPVLILLVSVDAMPTTTSSDGATARLLPPREVSESSGGDTWRTSGVLRRSWYAMSEILSPFSPSALASLPKKTFQRRPRYTRADNVPDAPEDEHGQMPTVRDYHAINSLPPQVRVPKKIATPIKVEGKVWFANERSAYCTSRVSAGM